MKLIKMVPFIAVAGLSACGEANDNTNGGGAGGAPLLSFSELTAVTTGLIAEVSVEEPTPIDDIPDTGSAIYQGSLALFLQDSDDDGVLGQAQVNANFGTSTITGGANNFFDTDGNATEGTLTIVNGTLSSGTGLAQGQLNGTVDFDAGSTTVTTNLTGVFLGDDAEYFTGAVNGSAAASGGELFNVQGSILAKQ